VTVPALRTERLVLRGWEERDREPWRAMNADPEVTRFVGDGQPWSAERSDQGIARYNRSWEENGYGLWAVEDRALGRCIGMCGTLVFPDGLERVEIGWRLERAAWGKGYATEGALATRDWAFESVPGLDRLIAVVNPANAASARVAEKIGMTFSARETGLAGEPVDVYAITSPASA
jgi:RimJ/RimL family protein N-acetyltransferase